MQDTSNFVKILLLLLVIGVWSILVRSFFTGSPMQLQSQKQYSVCGIDDNGNIIVGGGNSIGLTVAGLVHALEEAPRQGWKLHSVVGISSGGYVVIVEK